MSGRRARAACGEAVDFGATAPARLRRLCSACRWRRRGKRYRAASRSPLRAAAAPPGRPWLTIASTFLAERLDRLVEADQAFGGRQPAQRFAHLGKSTLDAGKRRRVDAGLAAMIDALASALTSISIDSSARRGNASVNERPISARSVRSPAIAVSSSLDGRSASIRAVIWRSCSSRPLISTGASGACLRTPAAGHAANTRRAPAQAAVPAAAAARSPNEGRRGSLTVARTRPRRNCRRQHRRRALLPRRYFGHRLVDRVVAALFRHRACGGLLEALSLPALTIGARLVVAVRTGLDRAGRDRGAFTLRPTGRCCRDIVALAGGASRGPHAGAARSSPRKFRRN